MIFKQKRGHVRLLLKHTALRNIFLLVALVLSCLTPVDFLLADGALPTRATLGRLSVCLLVFVCAALAHTERPRLAFCLFCVGQLLATYNAIVVAGFGVYSPALLYAFLPIVLAFALFGSPRAWWWASPTLCAWGFVFVDQFSGSGFLPVASATPSPLAWGMAQFTVLVTILAVVILYERHSSALLAAEAMRLVEASDRLKASEQFNGEREVFMANLSHELRTPLSAMRNAMSLAQHPKASDAIKDRSLKTLDAAIGNLQALLNNALDSFKYARGTFALDESEFAMGDFLRGIESLFAGLAESRGLEFRIETTGQTDLSLVGDTMRLGQMLSNLVSNAIKFTQKGHVRIHVQAPSTPFGLWRFEVIDTGPGIGLEDQRRLFMPFMQLHDPRIQGTKGSGLGLSIVSQLACAMGGGVGFSSEPGVGSVFYFELPLRRAQTMPTLVAVQRRHDNAQASVGEASEPMTAASARAQSKSA